MWHFWEIHIILYKIDYELWTFQYYLALFDIIDFILESGNMEFKF